MTASRDKLTEKAALTKNIDIEFTFVEMLNTSIYSKYRPSQWPKIFQIALNLFDFFINRWMARKYNNTFPNQSFRDRFPKNAYNYSFFLSVQFFYQSTF